MEWAARLGGSVQQQIIEEARTKIAALLAHAYDEAERATLQEAEAWLRNVKQP